MSQIKAKPPQPQMVQPKVVITVVNPTTNPPHLKVEYRGLVNWEICAFVLAHAQTIALSEDLKAKAGERKLIQVPEMMVRGKIS